jgi:lipopolysaccharide biosynthesis regulator YciM
MSSPLTNKIPQEVYVLNVHEMTSPLVSSAPPDAFVDRLEYAINLWKEGVDGSVAAVQQADRLFEQLRSEDPVNPLLDAYQGSTMILIARDKTKLLEKLRWSKNGLKLLDKAVAADPQDTMIRILRGKAAFKLPEKHFQRTQTAIEDYRFVIEQESSHEGFLEVDEYAEIIYEIGEAYQRIGQNKEAALWWSTLQQQTQKPELQSMLQQKLRSLEGKPAVEHIPSNVSPTSMLLGNLAHATGSALQRWGGMESEKARKAREKREKELKEKARKEKEKPQKENKKKEAAKRSKSSKSSKNNRNKK